MAYGQRYQLSYCRQLTYPRNAGNLVQITAKIFQKGYVSGGGIILSPAQVASFSGRLGGVNLTSTAGVIVMQWTAQLINTYSKYPLIWAYYNGQLQPCIPELDNTDSPTTITINLGVIPSTDLVLIIAKPEVITQYTNAFLTGTSGMIIEAVDSFYIFYAYYEDQYHVLNQIALDNNDTPTTATIDLGTIPLGNTYLERKTPDAILTYTQAQMITSGGIITINNVQDYGLYPTFYAYYDSKIQPITPVLTPSTATIDLGTIPLGNTHILIVNGATATGITTLKGATAEPISIPCIQGDPRDKMQPLKGSNSTTRVVAGSGYGIDIADVYTDDETEFYEEIDISQPDDTFVVSWTLDDNPSSILVDRNLFIYVNGVLQVSAFVPSSGSFRVNRGDTVLANTSTGVPWPSVNNPYAALFMTSKVSLFTDDETTAQELQTDSIDKDIIILSQSYYEADFIAMRSGIFYNISTGYPVVYSPIYHGATQVNADNNAASDADYYINGQAYANSYPIGYPAFWRGFLVIDAGTQQPFQTPSVLELSFVDGIGLLKNLLFADAGGNFFTGKATPKEIIYECLYALGVPDMNFYTHLEIFESSMDETEDAMTQVLHQLETYYLSTQTKPLDMGQVMEAVLRVYGLEIRQNLGEWWITEIDSLYTAGSKDWFRYSGVTGDFIQLYPYNPRRTLGSIHLSTWDAIFARADQVKVIDRAYRGQILQYTFKAATQINRNPNLIPEVSGGGYIWPGWTVDPLGSGNVNPGPDNNGARIDSNATRPADPPVIKMTSENIAVQPADLLDFNFGFNNSGPVAFSKLQVTFNNGGSTYYLGADGTWDSLSVQTIYTYNGQVLRNPLGPTPPGDYLQAVDSNLTFKIAADPIPGIIAGNVNIILYDYDYSQNNSLGADEQNDPTYPNFTGTTTWNLAKASFAVTPTDQGTPLGTFYIAANVGNATFTPPILQVLNADDDTAKYVGTLYQDDGATPTRTWHRADDPYDTKPLLWIIAEMYVRMYQNPFYIYQGSIYGIFPQLTTWDIEQYDGIYINVGTDYNLGSMLHNSNLIQIDNESIFGAPQTIEETDYGQYNDGDLPVIVPG